MPTPITPPTHPHISTYSDNNHAAIIDSGLEQQQSPAMSGVRHTTHEAGPLSNLPTSIPGSTQNQNGIFSTFVSHVLNSATRLAHVVSTTVDQYRHPVQTPIGEVQVALRDLSQNVQDPLFPACPYVNGRLNYANAERLIAQLANHYRESVDLPIDDQIGQSLSDMSTHIAQRLHRQLTTEKLQHLLTKPTTELTSDEKIQLDRIMLSATADKWEALEKLIASTLVSETTDHDLVGLALSDSHINAPTANTSNTIHSATQQHRQTYLRELQRFCHLQSDYVRANNIANTTVVAGMHDAVRFNDLKAHSSSLTPEIGSTLRQQTGGALNAGLTTPFFAPSVDIDVDTGAKFTTGDLTYTDTDGDFNRINNWTLTGQFTPRISTPFIKGAAANQVTHERRTYNGSFLPLAAYAASHLEQVYSPHDPSRITDAWHALGDGMTYFAGGTPSTHAQKNMRKCSMNVHKGIYAIPAIQRSAAAMDEIANRADGPHAGEFIPRINLKEALLNTLPTHTQRLEKMGIVTPDNPLNMTSTHLEIPFSVPAAPSAEGQPTQAARYPWHVTTYSTMPTVTAAISAQQYKTDPTSGDLLKPGFAPSANASAELHLIESHLPLTRLNPSSGDHADTYPERGPVELSKVIRAIHTQTVNGETTRSADAQPFGNAGALHLLNKHFPRGENDQALIDISEPLHEGDRTIDKFQYYASRHEMHPAFQHLLQALELHLGSEGTTGVAPLQVFKALQTSYKDTSADYAEVTRLIWEAKSAANYGDAATENEALQGIKHLVFNDQHRGRVTAASPEKEKDDLCILAIQMFDLHLNTLDRMFEMTKFNYAVLEHTYGNSNPTLQMTGQALQATQAQRNCSVDHFKVERGGIPRVAIARSHFLAASSASEKTTKGVTVSATLDLGIRKAVDRRDPKLKDWLPSGAMLLDKVGKLTINGTVDFANQSQHPAWHREALRTDVTLDLKLNASLAGVPIALMAEKITEACMSKCQGMEDESHLQALSRKLKEFFTETLAKDGLLSLLNAGRTLRLELRLERPHPLKGETTVNKTAFTRFGIVDDADLGLSLFPPKVKDLAAIQTPVGPIKFSPEFIKTASAYEVSGAHVGDSVRAALTMYPRLLLLMLPANSSAIDFQHAYTTLSKPENLPSMHMWFGGAKTDPFVSIVADALRAKERDFDSEEGPSGRSEFDYLLTGPSIGAHTPTRATYLKSVYDSCRAGTTYKGAPPPAQSNYAKLDEILNTLSMELLNRAYTGGPHEKQQLLEAFSNLSRQDTTANHRLTRYMTTPQGQAIIQAVHSLLAIAGSYSTTRRLGDYYGTKENKNAINYYFKPDSTRDMSVQPQSPIEVRSQPHRPSPSDLFLLSAMKRQMNMCYQNASQRTEIRDKLDELYIATEHQMRRLNPVNEMQPPPVIIRRRQPQITLGADASRSHNTAAPIPSSVLLPEDVRDGYGVEKNPDFGEITHF